MQNTIHQKIIEYIVESSVFLFLLDFKMQIKLIFMFLEIWLFGFGKSLDEFCKFFKGVFTNPDLYSFKNFSKGFNFSKN